MKYPPEFYNEDYYKTVVDIKTGRTRWDDNGTFLNCALFIDAFLKKYGTKHEKILEVGCGRGHIIAHLRNLGYDAYGCEYGKTILKDSVCNAIYCDLTDRLPYSDKEFDFVFCLGVLSQFDRIYARKAIAELKRVSSRWILTNILVKNHEMQAYHKNVVPAAWWIDKFN